MKYLAKNMKAIADAAIVQSKPILYRAIQRIQEQAKKGKYEADIWCETQYDTNLREDLLELGYYVTYILENVGSTKFLVEWD